ncbi:hypothetical protein LTR62_004746 [Meristemomyces frigidus]|uniref:NADH-ubiquinone oxidoreductase 29.9 kDa subunit n=1 Tax=Meristemomyces frigidus TaxID=1508187 RepID=A0AAN7YJP3_9PEZI|nr:hypothetical protein LTR62_004746 [Meristemomyces frigidus]
MRATLVRLATAAKESSLPTGNPTGLTGLFTHPSPRSTLLYLYSTTLQKLRQSFPESSVYRQSLEAVTKHRMSIIETTKPAGLEAWQERVKALVDAHPDAFRRIPLETQKSASGNEFNLIWRPSVVEGLKENEWDDEYTGKAQLEGPRSAEARADQGDILNQDPIEEHSRIPRIEPEPPLSVQQIEEVENKIGAGLIEEVIVVAEGERDLVDVMAESKVWEDLEEKPAEGQWTYFERRDTHTPTTQAR